MWDELEIEQDPRFLVRDACRRAGIPVEIAVTERLLIRETILSDVPALYEIWKQPHVGDYIRPLQPTLEEELEFMEAYIRHAYAFYDFGLWTVVERYSGEIIGRAGLFPSEILEDAVELGYMIAPQYQRQGYATECGCTILSYAAEVLDMEELHLLADVRNQASVRTAEKLGFQKEEMLHQDDAEAVHYIWRRGS